MRTDYYPIKPTITPGSMITVPVGGGKGMQAAVISHVARSGTVYGCKWLARGKRWTKPIPLDFMVRYGFGSIKPDRPAPIKS